MLVRLFRYILFIALIIFSWQACDEDDPSVNASRLRLKLTDATSLVLKELHVDIREIAVFLVDTASQEGEWVTLEFSGRSYDVLTLINGKTVQLVDQYVPTGKELQQIRLMFGNDSRMVTNTAQPIPLHIPPEIEEGAVIDAIKMELRLNTISSMIIDLNAALSVREENGSYFLYPVLRAFPETYGGKLRGYVAPPGACAFVAIVQDEDTLLTLPRRESTADNMEIFQFIGLAEGEWEVHLVANPETDYQDTVVITTVETGKLKDITPKPVTLKRPSTEE